MVYLKVAEKLDPHTRLEKMQFMIFTLEQTIKVRPPRPQVLRLFGFRHRFATDRILTRRSSLHSAWRRNGG